MTRTVAIGLLCVLPFLSEILALPRFAVRTGAKCQSCHINPSGAGMRQVFGAQYGREKLPVATWDSASELEDFTTLLTNFVGVGADFRTLYFYRQLPDTGGASNRNSFFQMQGDLDLNFRIAKNVSVYLSKGLYSGFETFGLFSVLPAKGYIKVGRFVPDFGTKLDDHTAYIRAMTGFGSEQGPALELTGAELGISPGPWTVVGGFYNATDGYAGSGGNNKALLGRAEGMFELAEEFHFGLGGDVFTTENNLGIRKTMYGGIGSISYHDVALFGEVDFIRTSGGGIPTVRGIVTYVEASFLVTPGLDLKLAYDFYDPDIDYKTGSQSRVTVGCEFFPVGGVEVRPLYRFNMETPTEVRNNELDILIHFYL